MKTFGQFTESLNDRRSVVKQLQASGYEQHKSGACGDHEKWKHTQTGQTIVLPRSKTFSPGVVSQIKRKLKSNGSSAN